MRRAVVVVLMLASTARADFFNARNLLLGERASLLGGAFTALSDDGTAGYYNPAGLVQLPGFTLAASADIYGLYLLDRIEQVNDQGDLLPLPFVRTVILPSTFALSYRVHDRVTLAAHVFSPDRFRLSALNSVEAPVVAKAIGSDQVFGGLSRSARFDQSTTLYGVSAGFQVTDWFSFGVSLHYQLTQTSQALASTYFTHASEDGTVPAAQATVTADNEVTSGGFIPQVGVLFRLPHGLRVGASWQCETLRIHGTNYWQVALSSSSLGESLQSGETRGDVRYPHKFSLGLAWKGRVVTLSLDLIAYLGLDYDAPHEVFRTQFATNRHVEVPHFDASLGVEVELSAMFALRGGLFTNTSSASQQYAEERVDVFGGVIGLAVRKDGLETGFGVMGQYGRSPFQRENEQGLLTQWRRAQLMFVLGGSHRFFEK